MGIYFFSLVMDKKNKQTIYFLDFLDFLIFLVPILTNPNLPFLAVYPYFFKRISFLAVACFLELTIRPHLFIIN